MLQCMHSLASVARFAAFVLLAQCLLATGAGAIEPIRIGVTGPFTGGSSPMGLSMRDGIRLAAQEINAAGGILGRPLRLIERDDEARPERGAQVAQDLISRDKIVAGLEKHGFEVAPLLKEKAEKKERFNR